MHLTASFWASTALLLSPAAAARYIYDGNCTTTGQINSTASWTTHDFGPQNATKMTEFTVSEFGDDKKFYYYLALSELLDDPKMGHWLGIPKAVLSDDKDNQTRLCAYNMAVTSKKIDDGAKGNATCDGIVPEKCLDSFQYLPGYECPAVLRSKDCDVETQKATSILLSKDNACLGTSLPDFNVPADYVVAELGVYAALNSIDDDQYKTYDDFARKSRPLLTFFDETTRTAVDSSAQRVFGKERICAAATDVKKGSRVPPKASGGAIARMSMYAAIVAVFSLLL